MGKDLRNKELGLGISQRKDGVYVARFTNRAGKRIFFCDTNLSLLRRKFEKAKVEDYENRSVASGSYTLKEWYDFWIKNFKIPNEVTPQYIEHLDATFNKYILLKDRGDIDLRDLRNIDIQLMVNEAKENSISASRNLLSILKQMLELAYENDLIEKNPAKSVHIKKPKRKSTESMSRKDEKMLLKHISSQQVRDMVLMMLNTGLRISDDDDKIRLNQRKPSKYKGLRRFGPEKNLQRINKFMKERPIFYKNLIQMKENIRFYLRCFYCITKVMILQFNSENRTELARNG